MTSTTGRLTRQFPEICTKVNEATTTDKRFHHAVAEALAKLDKDEVEGLKPKRLINKDTEKKDKLRPEGSQDDSENDDEEQTSKKKKRKKLAPKLVEDYADATMPKHIIDIFFPFLFAHGVEATGLRIWKHTRDNPLVVDKLTIQRRSSILLLLKVALQQELSDPKNLSDCTLYKKFMLVFYAVLLDAACGHKMDSETLHMMRRKIGYRRMKLIDCPPGQWQSLVAEALQGAAKILATRKKTIMKAISPSTANRLSWCHPGSADLSFRFPQLTSFVNTIKTPVLLRRKEVPDPKCEVIIWGADALPSPKLLSKTPTQYDIANMIAMESWVEEYLPNFTEQKKASPGVCQDLMTFAKKYHNRAKVAYGGCPVNLSQMYLTLLEIWVACDKVACHLNRYLKDYKPLGVEDISWSPLLLATESSLDRLQKAETYIVERSYGKKNMIETYATEECFSVRSALSQAKYQALLDEILADDNKRKEELRSTLEETKDKKFKYLHEHNRLHCDLTHCRADTGGAACKKCNLLIAAREMTIQPCSEALPRNEKKRWAAVFELEIPEHFAVWRDFCLYLITDIAHYTTSRLEPAYKSYLRTEATLSRFFIGDKGSRICVASPPPQRKNAPVEIEQDTTIDDIWNLSDKRWALLDSGQHKYLGEFSSSPELSEACSVKIDDKSHVLQKFLCQPISEAEERLDQNTLILLRHTLQNTTMIKHNEELGSLRIGDRTPWTKFVRSLRSSSIDWTAAEAFLFTFQMAFEATDLDDQGPKRERHTQLHNESFVKNMLEVMQQRMVDFRANVSGRRAIATFAVVAMKTLTVDVKPCHELALSILQECQNTLIKWLMHLRQAKDTSPEGLKLKLELALIYAFTCSVEGRDLQRLLDNDVNFMHYLFAIIVIQENESKVSGSFQRVLYSKWQRAAFAASRIAMDHVTAGNTPRVVNAIDLALDGTLKISVAMRPVNGPWIRGSTEDQLSTVHLNLMTGEMLVDGRAQAHLSSEFLRNDEFCHLLGADNSAVTPISRARYQYIMRRKVSDFTVFIGWGKETVTAGMPSRDLNVMAERYNESFILVPKRILRSQAENLPEKFISQYVHWLNKNSGNVEFRPRESPWKPESSSWFLCPVGHNWLLRDKGAIRSIAPMTHQHYKYFAEIFHSFSTTPDLIVCLNIPEKKIEARLESFDLDFYVKNKETTVRSVQYEDMCIDDEYALKTLIGLRSKLILSHVRQADNRIVIIPDGEAKISEVGKHRRSVDIEARKTSLIQVYTIDERLCQLKGNGTFRSKIYLAYLHALTSQVFSDPFTGHTGQEVALDILRSGSVSSFQSISPDDISLLTAISYLSPTRKWGRISYMPVPSIAWKRNASYLAHHEGYITAVEAIIGNATDLAKFSSSNGFVKPKLNCSQMKLREGDMRRQACFRTDGYGGEAQFSGADKVYNYLREQMSGESHTMNEDTDVNDEDATAYRSVGFHTAFCAAYSARKQCVVDTDFPSWDEIASQVTVKNIFKGATTHFDASSFTYDKRWADQTTNTFREDWCSIHNAFQVNTKDLNPFRLQLWLSAVFYSMEQLVGETLIPPVIAIIRDPKNDGIHIPQSTNTQMGHGLEYSEEKVISALEPTRLKESLVFKGEKLHTAQTKAIEKVAQEVAAGKTPNFDSCKYILDTQAANEALAKLKTFCSSLQSTKLYFEKLAELASHLPAESPARPLLEFADKETMPKQNAGYISMKAIFKQPIETFQSQNDWRGSYVKTLETFLVSKEIRIQPALRSLAAKLNELASKPYEREYVAALGSSISDLGGKKSVSAVVPDLAELEQCLQKYSKAIQDRIKARQSAVTKAAAKVIRTGLDTLYIVKETEILPRLTLTDLLRQLSSDKRGDLPTTWRECLQQLADLLRDRQHLLRIQSVTENKEALARELKTIRRYELDTSAFPDAVLLEIEQDISLRPEQLEIATQMRKPPGGKNAVMQLNMGEGKSSVIIPILSAALADGTDLVRVFAGKPQSKQMFDALVSAMGGLMNRRIYSFPFTRESQLKPESIRKILTLLEDCQETGGILFMQLEQHLSLKLFVELNENITNTRALIKIIKLFYSSRDIIDEVDEIMSPNYELVYTLGRVGAVDYAPNRWQCIQQLLELFRLCSNDNMNDDDILYTDIDERLDGYPDIRFLTDRAFDDTIGLVVQRFMKSGLKLLTTRHVKQDGKDAIRDFLTLPRPDENTVTRMRKFTALRQSGFALLRGAFQGNLRTMFMEKRWRVDYGRDVNRMPRMRTAVPFAAKDTPKPRAEYSSPDAVIQFTYMAYYQDGLREEDVKELITYLRKQSNGRDNYASWFRQKSRVPGQFRKLDMISLRNDGEFAQFYPKIKYSVNAINHFLDKIVFPREIGEFTQYLSASGWDLGERKAKPTTGFSGTNDLCAVLPLDMEKQELPSQTHTDALVLNNILGNTNAVVSLHKKLKVTSSGGSELVDDIAKDSDIRVFLDVGAQVIQYSNAQVVARWLKKTTDNSVNAGIFFNDADELHVMDRSGVVMPLKMSIFAKKLDDCVVFLDESHTRGIDIRLPSYYRAAVTLGSGLTKDRLVQGKCFTEEDPGVEGCANKYKQLACE